MKLSLKRYEFYFDNRKVRSIERRHKLYKHRVEYEFGNMNIFKITPNIY